MNPTITIDQQCFTITVNGQVLRPRPSLFALIKALHGNPGRVYSKEQVLDVIGRSWNSEETAIHHIKRARKLLRSVCPDEELILTRRDLGYYWRTE